MAVHLPLSQEAQAECRFLLLSPNNLLKPSDGGPVAVPSQDMVLGIYYLTQERPGNKGEGKFFKSVNEAILAYENKVITLQTKIIVHCHKTMPDGTVLSGNVQSTLGRFLFNEILPQDLGFCLLYTSQPGIWSCLGDRSGYCCRRRRIKTSKVKLPLLEKHYKIGRAHV